MPIGTSWPKSKDEIERERAFVERHPRTWWLISGAKAIGLVLGVILLGGAAGFAGLAGIAGAAYFLQMLGVWAD